MPTIHWWVNGYQPSGWKGDNMGVAVTKVCHVCGKDVSNEKRTKDTAGRYYCDPCSQVVRRSPVTPQAPAMPERPTSDVPSERPATGASMSAAKYGHRPADALSPSEKKSLQPKVKVGIGVAAVVLLALVYWQKSSGRRDQQNTQDSTATHKTKEQADAFGHTEPSRKALLSYVNSCSPFVMELKGLQARLDSGMDYAEFRAKMQSVTDAYAQLDDTPATEDSKPRTFRSYADRAMREYGEALRIWGSIINGSFVYTKGDRDEHLRSGGTAAATAIPIFESLKIESKQ